MGLCIWVGQDHSLWVGEILVNVIELFKLTESSHGLVYICGRRKFVMGERDNCACDRVI